jgi:ABC-type branched-subunit amino acid transport system substrate-binding protein
MSKSPDMSIRKPFVFMLLCMIAAFATCTPRMATPSQKPNPKPSTKPTPGYERMDTVRWTTPGNAKPPIKNEPKNNPGGQNTGGQNNAVGNGETYRIAFLLPFLSNQAENTSVPEKSRLALQFYAGAKIALEQLSKETRINIVADVYDTQSSDADFQLLLKNPKLSKASVFIGPIRSSHVQTMAEWTKQNRKILISPDAPNSDLSFANPDFIQINPSLRAHCRAITKHIRKTHKADAVTLVCKEKESDRLTYFQEANTAIGGGQLGSLVVPDATNSFANIDLKKHLKPGRTSVFVLPSWSSQDFVMAFLRNLKAVKGANRVEVYGMPQWKNFDAIEAEYFSSLNVHITSASYVPYSADNVRAFQQHFYEATGTIPDTDGFNGYDVTLFVGRMLARYGLSFPERLDFETFRALHADFRFIPVFSASNPDTGTRERADYLENEFVHILKFGPVGFVPE